MRLSHAVPMTVGRERVVQDQTIDPLGELGGEELTHHAAFGDAEHRRTIPTDGVHHRGHVGDALLE